jgi:hypothetical protein
MGFWIIGNGSLVAHNYLKKDYDQLTLFSAYEVINVIGIAFYLYRW